MSAWWEPTYAPTLKMTSGTWELADNAAEKRVFVADSFKEETAKRVERRKFTNTRFRSCDFTGRFDSSAVGSSFVSCEFYNCDFGTSTWARVKFRECKFIECSFSQSTWRDAEFRCCEWNSIGLSGNETVLERVYISNASEFIHAAYTNVDEIVLRERNVLPEFQKVRLEETKATVARSLFNSHKVVGNDAAFYGAFSTYVKQYHDSVVADTAFQLSAAQGLAWLRIAIALKVAQAEGALVKLFGRITRWGSSVLSPLILLVATFLVFSAFYRLLFFTDMLEAFSVAFDVTTVAGFTRPFSEDSPKWLHFVAGVNLLFSLVFYSAFFSVAFSKISRVR